jgi:fucose permease
MAMIASGMCSATLITIASIVKVEYELSTFVANLNNLLFLIMYLPGNFISILVLNKYGLRMCLICGASLIMIGSWIRTLVIFAGYKTFLIGSLIAATGQPFLMNNSSKIASAWFGDKERAIATALGSMSVNVGQIISFLLPSTVIS